MNSISYIVAKAIKKIQIPAVKNCNIDKKAKVCTGAHIVNSKISKYSYVGNFSTILNCEIGKFCSIADNCVIGGMAHPTNWVTSSPVAYNGKNCLKTNFSNLSFCESEKTNIGHDVWIGNNCLIKAGITLQTGCIIGMGSVVTKDVGPYEIWAGNPAKLIRKRFDEDIIKHLLESEWWELDEESLKKYGDSLNEPLSFLNRMESK